MTVSQWVFVGGLAATAAALAVISLLSWRRRRDTDALLGMAFAVIAVVSTINLTLVGHRGRVTAEEYGARLDCMQAVIAVLQGRDEVMLAGADPRAIPFPACWTDGQR